MTAVGGLTFFGADLLGVVNDSLYQIDPETGAATLIGAIGFTGVSSLVSVPEPGSGALVALGLLGLVACRRRPLSPGFAGKSVSRARRGARPRRLRLPGSAARA